jgi:hypothetical protein
MRIIKRVLAGNFAIQVTLNRVKKACYRLRDRYGQIVLPRLTAFDITSTKR